MMGLLMSPSRNECDLPMYAQLCVCECLVESQQRTLLTQNRTNCVKESG